MAVVTERSKWHNWLVGQGIITDDDQAYHVVIDICVGEPIKVHVSKYTEDLRVLPPEVDESCVIRVGDAPEVTRTT